jgi:hypothetical protein
LGYDKRNDRENVLPSVMLNLVSQYWVAHVIDFVHIIGRLDDNEVITEIIPTTKKFPRLRKGGHAFVRRIRRFARLLTREILSLDGKLLILLGGIKRHI